MNAEDKVVKFYFKDLQPGVHGIDGKDGVSPLIDVEEIENGHRLNIVDNDGRKSVDILNGTNGKDGVDGVSPTAAIETTESGHRVTFTDAEGDKTFNVTNGLSPLPTKNAVTNYLMNQSSNNLMELVDGADATTLPVVQLSGNRIVETDLAASTDSGARMFLLSKNPRYLLNGLSDLADDDYITLNYDRGSNLYCVISGLVQTPGTQIANMAPHFTIYAKTSGSTGVYTTTCTMPCGAGGNGITQFGNVVYSVDDGNPRNEYVTLSIAVVGTIYPYYQNYDVSLDFYFGLMDMNSEQTNLVGTFNNSLYATKAYQKNDLIVQNDQLYRANWDIAKGNRMDVERDIIPTTLSNELKELRAMITELQAKG